MFDHTSLITVLSRSIVEKLLYSSKFPSNTIKDGRNKLIVNIPIIGIFSRQNFFEKLNFHALNVSRRTSRIYVTFFYIFCASLLWFALPLQSLKSGRLPSCQTAIIINVYENTTVVALINSISKKSYKIWHLSSLNICDTI